MEVTTVMDPTPNRWNDDKLDEFARNVDRRFDEVDERFDKVDQRFDRVDERFDKVDKRFDQVEVAFNRINDRLDDMFKAFVGGFIALTCGVIAGFVAIFAVIVTQL